MKKNKNKLQENFEQIGTDACKLRSLVHILISCIYMEIENEIDMKDIQTLVEIIHNKVIEINDSINNICEKLNNNV